MTELESLVLVRLYAGMLMVLTNTCNKGKPKQIICQMPSTNDTWSLVNHILYGKNTV